MILTLNEQQRMYNQKTKIIHSNLNSSMMRAYSYSFTHDLKLVEAEWRIYASVKHIFASDNGLLPGRH